MKIEILNKLLDIVVNCTVPGCAGGIALFLLSYKKGHYKNNKYFIKFCIEIFGAMITATFITSGLFQNNYQIPIAFMIGVGWVNVLQKIRVKVTSLVEKKLNN